MNSNYEHSDSLLNHDSALEFLLLQLPGSEHLEQLFFCQLLQFLFTATDPIQAFKRLFYLSFPLGQLQFLHLLQRPFLSEFEFRIPIIDILREPMIFVHNTHETVTELAGLGKLLVGKCWSSCS